MLMWGGALDGLAREVERVYVHLDLDALSDDRLCGRGSAGPPAASPMRAQRPGGQVRERFAVIGATIATYTPAKDRGPTLRAAMAAIRVLIRRPSQQPNAK